MKKNLLTLIGLFLIFPAAAQITVTSDHIVGAGATVVQGIDTITPLTPGGGGANQSWDFTSVVVQDYDTMWFMLPEETPYPSAYPSANLAAEIYQEEMFVFFNSNTQEMALLGGAWIEESTIPPVIAPITPKSVIAAWPMDYLDNYTESYVQEFKFPTPLPLSMDSIWIKFYTDKTTVVDAWGTITTPLGTYEALRVRENTSDKDSIWAYMRGGWTLVEAESKIDENYSWWTNDPDIGFPIVELNIDTGTGLPDDIFFLLHEPVYGIGEPAVAGSVMAIFPNPALDHLTIRYRVPDPSTTLGTGSGYRMIDLYSIEGRKIRELVNEEMPAGTHEMEIDVSDLPAGVYFIRVQAGSEIAVRKLIVAD